ncbi:plastocyanin/azurin family copper-binding protein [Pontibacter russatus]|uniref:plastocyanin/azurin family copper-binding protein n=1 Tax=Pontibacter russatus TaxID=2694929 RepID=UPI00137988FA|nr:plastocyanin/azurin family copper-binding protein [Pontibacter russatus]
MKNNLFLYLCLGTFIACASETKTQSEGEVTEAITLDNQEAPVQPDTDTGVVVEETYEGSGTLTETEEEPASQPDAVATPAEAKSVATTTEAKPAQPKASTTPKAAAKPAEPVQTKPAPVQANTVIMSIVPDMMKFDKEVFTVIAGQKVIIELENPDGMQHNMVISKPGTLKEVGAAADALARDPKGAQLNYVPQIPAVLFATKLLNPEEVVTLTFTAPSEPGDYTFVCTFPGHWRMMNGIMKVTK